MDETCSISGGAEVVLFDYGGVLSAEGWKKGLSLIARENGLDSDKFIRTAADTVYETGYILGEASQDDFWRELKIRTGIRGDETSFADELMSHFVLDERMIDLARRLNAGGITIGILSDQTDWLDQLDARDDFFKYFDHVFNSYHMGKGKRDATLFDDIAAKLKTKPQKILFIDDDPGNVERARQKGWQACIYTVAEVDSFHEQMERAFGIRK
jgi:putative hydrolase of the HAD superfamily